MNGVLRAGLVAALLMAALATAGCSSPPACAAASGSCAPPMPPWLAFTTTVNGRSASLPKIGPLPSFHVRAGEHLVMSVAVTVPRHLRVTVLWLGISTGIWGNGPNGRPVGMRPILARSRQPLTPGVHTFWLRWHVPKGRSGGNLYLITAWSTHQPPVDVARAIAVLALN